MTIVICSFSKKVLLDNEHLFDEQILEENSRDFRVVASIYALDLRSKFKKKNLKCFEYQQFIISDHFVPDISKVNKIILLKSNSKMKSFSGCTFILF